MSASVRLDVIGGLDPAIHGPACEDGPGMDGRVRPGHDERGVVPHA
jgi:hypothetical protein